MHTPPVDPPARVTGAQTATRRVVTDLPPDSRELACVAFSGVVAVTAVATGAGQRALATWLPSDLATATPAEVVVLVVAQFFPWLLALAVLSVPFALRWLPRVNARLLEPSLIAAWVTVALAAGTTWLLGTSGIWSWSWGATTAGAADAVTHLYRTEQFVPLGLWLVGACLLVPIVLELLFRFALLEFLRQRGLADGVAIAVSALAFGAFSLRFWASPGASVLQQIAVASVLGAILGAVVVYARSGRGLGLVILAHGSFVAVQLAVLLRSVSTG